MHEMAECEVGHDQNNRSVTFRRYLEHIGMTQPMIERLLLTVAAAYDREMAADWFAAYGDLEK
jgi:hypothetical protein